MPFAAPGFRSGQPGGGTIRSRISLAFDRGGFDRDWLVPRNFRRTHFISRVSSFEAPVQFADWKAINAEALITGAVNVSGNRLTVRFRVWDVFSGQELGDGLQFAGTTDGWRRMAHKVADQVYSPDHR